MPYVVTESPTRRVLGYNNPTTHFLLPSVKDFLSIAYPGTCTWFTTVARAVLQSCLYFQLNIIFAEGIPGLLRLWSTQWGLIWDPEKTQIALGWWANKCGAHRASYLIWLFFSPPQKLEGKFSPESKLPGVLRFKALWILFGICLEGYFFSFYIKRPCLSVSSPFHTLAWFQGIRLFLGTVLTMDLVFRFWWFELSVSLILFLFCWNCVL